MSTRALPSFFVIGAAKAGTTSLHSYLGLHPEIQMSSVKEPGFFAGPANGRPYPKGRVERQADYEALFDPAFAIRGESSPNYAMDPIRTGVPERIAALVPEAKLVYLLRDPVERAISHHRHRVALGEERRSLTALLDEAEDIRQVPETCMSLYGRQLERYLSVFAAERVLIVEHRQLLRDRESTLRTIFGFLGARPDFSHPDFAHEAYATRERRRYPRGYEHLIGRTIGPRLRWIPAGARRRARTGLERALFEKVRQEPATPEVRERLAEVLAPDAARLRAVTGRAFAEWSV